MIGIIDYKCGNITSIRNMLEYLGYDSLLIKSKKDLDRCKFLILPGVGSFDFGIKSFRSSSYFSRVEDLILRKGIPTLGICLGMQLMTNGSEEGNEKGLAWFDLHTKKFPKLGFHKIPNMGWNFIKEKNSLRLKDNFNNDRFYFVHSYYVEVNSDYTSYISHYAETDYSAIISRDNMIGVQFHPEKSHLFGMKLLKNILESKIE